MNSIPLLFLSPKSPQTPLPPLPPSNLNNNKPHKIRQTPITAMCGEHVEVLYIQRAAATRKKVIDLSVVVEEEHAFFGDFFAREVVRFQLDVRGKFGGCDGGGVGGG